MGKSEIAVLAVAIALREMEARLKLVTEKVDIGPDRELGVPDHGHVHGRLYVRETEVVHTQDTEVFHHVKTDLEAEDEEAPVTTAIVPHNEIRTIAMTIELSISVTALMNSRVGVVAVEAMTPVTDYMLKTEGHDLIIMIGETTIETTKDEMISPIEVDEGLKT
ncbi:hypothetical protein BGZ80_004818 [Entomortierella chlamydospora]|uniref:Uncharacterized protein n=1 Tax=Entomortierella chlamydospora TaxID=101097 RepID=A0A9P6MMX4_9FUNG|nr:hypothetical protein BGZ80_004818 [Entomortierella chlamydospora]